jgi:N-acetyl-gamma-glutamyl-phosphate reductase
MVTATSNEILKDRVLKTNSGAQSCKKAATNRIKVSVAGASGYTGQELIRLLMQHPEVEIVAVASRSLEGETLCRAIPGLSVYQAGETADLVISGFDIDALAKTSDVVFLALPHGIASDAVSKSTLEKAKIIDLSGDFRLKGEGNVAGDPALHQEAVYGLSELNGDAIAAARLIANPGCYATAAILALAPVVANNLIDTRSIILDGKSGVSGAGRVPSMKTHFGECNESVSLYQVPYHRHTDEIEATLSGFSGREIATTFSAHLVPINRGILMTAYASLNAMVSPADIDRIYNSFYAGSPFVRLRSTACLDTRLVRGSNCCDIGFAIDERSRRIVIVSVIDNLMKGASGQAVQNMNLSMGIEETLGLGQIPVLV